VTPVILSYISPAAFLNHDTKAPHFFCSSSSVQHQEKQMIYPRRGSWWSSQHVTQHLQWSLRWKFRARWPASSGTMQGNNGHAAIERFFHVYILITGCSKSIDCCIRTTPTCWAAGRLYLSEEEDERKPVSQASKKLFHEAFQRLNLPTNVHIY